MKLLVDENLSLRVVEHLRDHGYDAVHVLQLELGSTPDDVIIAEAAVADRVMITADTDFGTLLARSGDAWPSVVTLRSSDQLSPEDQADLVVQALQSVGDDLAAGAIATITPSRLRMRRLPI